MLREGITMRIDMMRDSMNDAIGGLDIAIDCLTDVAEHVPALREFALEQRRHLEQIHVELIKWEKQPGMPAEVTRP